MGRADCSDNGHVINMRSCILMSGPPAHEEVVAPVDAAKIAQHFDHLDPSFEEDPFLPRPGGDALSMPGGAQRQI